MNDCLVCCICCNTATCTHESIHESILKLLQNYHLLHEILNVRYDMSSMPDVNTVCTLCRATVLQYHPLLCMHNLICAAIMPHACNPMPMQLSQCHLQGPLSRFGDTAANAGTLSLLDSYELTSGLNVGLKTVVASAAAASFRILLMPIDATKTIMQVLCRSAQLHLALWCIKFFPATATMPCLDQQVDMRHMMICAAVLRGMSG